MTTDALFIGLLILACFFLMISRKLNRNVLVGLVTFMLWFGLGGWLFLSTDAPLAFDGSFWKDVLGWAFLCISFLPLVFAMDDQISMESNGKRWTVFGQPPPDVTPSGYERYKKDLQNRTRGRQ